VGINLNNAGFLEQGKTNPVLTVKSSAITKNRNTCAVIYVSQKETYKKMQIKPKQLQTCDT